MADKEVRIQYTIIIIIIIVSGDRELKRGKVRGGRRWPMGRGAKGGIP